jgi:hypothetical protein
MWIAPDTPRPARNGIALLWISVLITLIQQVLEATIEGGAAIGAVVVVLAIYGLVIFRASKRHNWARYVLLVWTALAAVLYLADPGVQVRPPWVHILIVFSFAAEIAGVCLLFSAPARQWYKPRGAT